MPDIRYRIYYNIVDVYRGDYGNEYSTSAPLYIESNVSIDDLKNKITAIIQEFVKTQARNLYIDSRNNELDIREIESNAPYYFGDHARIDFISPIMQFDADDNHVVDNNFYELLKEQKKLRLYEARDKLIQEELKTISDKIREESGEIFVNIQNSEIIWDDSHQLWYVILRGGRFVGRAITAHLIDEIESFTRYGSDGWRQGYMCGSPTYQCLENNRLLFENYDDAVACGIEVLDHT